MSMRSNILRAMAAAASGDGPTIAAMTEYIGNLKPWTIDKPAGAVSGDLLVFPMGSGDGREWSSGDALSTKWYQQSNNGGIPTNFYRRLDASDDARASYQFTALGGGGIQIVQNALLIKNGEIDAFGLPSPNLATMVAPAITVGANGSLVFIHILMGTTLPQTMTPPPEFTLVDHVMGTNTQQFLYKKAGVPAGDTGTATIGASNSGVSLQFSIKPL